MAEKEKAEEAATRARTERLAVMSNISALKFANETQVHGCCACESPSPPRPNPPLLCVASSCCAWSCCCAAVVQAKKMKRGEDRIAELEKEVETLKLARERDREAKGSLEETLQKVPAYPLCASVPSPTPSSVPDRLLLVSCPAPLFLFRVALVRRRIP